jgi:hypothetical protein
VRTYTGRLVLSTERVNFETAQRRAEEARRILERQGFHVSEFHLADEEGQKVEIESGASK